MQSDVISRVKKIYIKNKIDISSKIFPYYQTTDYYLTYHNMKDRLENMHECFLKQFTKHISEYSDVDCKISFYKFIIQKFKNIKKNIKNNSISDCFEISPYKKLGIIFVSDNISDYLIEYLFGGCELKNSSNGLFKKLTLSTINIVKKMFKIILEQYYFLWNKVSLCKMKLILNRLQNLNEISNVNFINSKDTFVTFLFRLRIANKFGMLGICLPTSLSFQCNNEADVNSVHNVSHISYDNVVNTEIRKRLFQVIVYNCKIVLKIVLIENYITLSKIIAFKVGDILPIHMLDNVVAYSENVPILIGKYKMFKNKYVFCVVDYYNSTLNYKNG
ncbi:flagellar motor switch protein FliM [Buchnera aphidicola str. Bp (Baizongia pistaciae)]|uniref:Flagellar motor switch protein FliM n=1 Tax=Buchnera aphidicola subsp. Baizongia pistaciae (strain Bp) TaxID=224915 RepID=FLIM_BUCBP|nr:FliM/FliN family flagellar motor switch protein [Buchnera aphidicola]Q89AZ4.1 RecName: Full=Flagellar motor switch protein FliM [Buchnera aphidicola str. Bp (Baizongia pistaciae)]AAO26810.1 flagellar motor switch protein FliM [Buchnera aphidicola str. Bp (Baizongia pistaciae)]